MSPASQPTVDLSVTLGRLTLRLAAPVAADDYRTGTSTGRAILIDEATNGTVGAAMIRRVG